MIKQVINSQDPKTLRIEYMIGNTCNHKCWYCFKGSNEGEFRWTDDFDATTKRELEDSLPLFYATQNKPHLLEVFTPSSLNDQVLLDYFEYLK